MSIAPQMPVQGLARYAALADALRQRIVRGEWLPGTALPSEQVLAHDHAVALGTMRRALQLLTEQGLIERVHGRGTFVRSGIPGASMLRFFRFGDEWEASPQPPSTAPDERAPRSSILSRQRLPATAEVAKALGLPARAPVLRLERLRWIAGQPRLLEHIWLPCDLFADLESDDPAQWQPLLYPLFAQRCDVHVHRAADDIAFGALPADVALHLALPPGHPCAIVRRKAFNLAGRCVEWRTTWGDAHAFHYTVHLT
jgi:GntR family transcriptional regulator